MQMQLFLLYNGLCTASVLCWRLLSISSNTSSFSLITSLFHDSFAVDSFPDTSGCAESWFSWNITGSDSNVFSKNIPVLVLPSDSAFHSSLGTRLGAGHPNTLTLPLLGFLHTGTSHGASPLFAHEDTTLGRYKACKSASPRKVCPSRSWRGAYESCFTACGYSSELISLNAVYMLLGKYAQFRFLELFDWWHICWPLGWVKSLQVVNFTRSIHVLNSLKLPTTWERLWIVYPFSNLQRSTMNVNIYPSFVRKTDSTGMSM